MKLSEKAKKSLDKVVEKFQAGDLSAITTTAFLPAVSDPDLDIPASKWSFRNRCIAFAQTGQIDCRGFRQWQKAGRKVKKGTKAAYILRPVVIKVKDDNGEEKQACVNFSSIPVFGQSDTEGDWLPEYAPAEPPPLLHIAEALDVSVDYGPNPLVINCFGLYNGKKKSIELCSHDLRIFFHELAHALHDRIEPIDGGQHVDQEVIADFTACVLMDIYGVDRSGNAWHYIEQYDDDPLLAVYRSLGTVEKIINLLVELDAQSA